MWSQDCLVSVKAKLRLGYSAFRIPVGSRTFLVSKNIQTCSRPQPIHCSMSAGDEVTKGNVKHSPPFNSKHILLATQKQMCNVLLSNTDITGIYNAAILFQEEVNNLQECLKNMNSNITNAGTNYPARRPKNNPLRCGRNYVYPRFKTLVRTHTFSPVVSICFSYRPNSRTKLRLSPPYSIN